ncbi:hypothetical protein NL676_015109 [Syzygium grande]|nr:hypothetical protein NL676_015109 [Syzygium grande]
MEFMKWVLTYIEEKERGGELGRRVTRGSDRDRSGIRSPDSVQLDPDFIMKDDPRIMPGPARVGKPETFEDWVDDCFEWILFDRAILHRPNPEDAPESGTVRYFGA